MSCEASQAAQRTIYRQASGDIRHAGNTLLQSTKTAITYLDPLSLGGT